MDNYFESTLEDVLRWDLLDQLGDFTTVLDDFGEDSATAHRPPKAVYSLQRDYISLYGSHPKMEDRIFSTCGVCEQVFNPQVVASHKEHCPGKGKIQSQQLRKKVKSKKKSQGASVPFPPLFKESSGPPVLSKFSDISPVNRLVPDVLPLPEPVKVEMMEPSPSTSVASPPTPPYPVVSPPHWELRASVGRCEEEVEVEEPPASSSRHKKKKSRGKDYEAEGDGQKGPCTRSNHKIQLRKLLVGRKKGSKEKESREKNFVGIEPKPEPENIYSIVQPQYNCVSESSGNISDYITSTHSSTMSLTENELHDEVESDDPSNQLESGYCSIETSLSTKSSPIVYFNPISPIFVVTPVQKENTVFVEAPPEVHSPPLNGYFLTMPEPSSNIKLYKSHPKPTILPTYGTRKVGGAVLGSNQRLEYQRNDIQMAITTK